MDKKIKVLIVDDSKYVIMMVTKRIEKDPDIEVIGSANNGVEAIEKVKSLHPDVVTMDIVMPEMDGLTALRHIMEDCPTPIVMLSALTSENAEPTIRALELGAVDFYLKPSVTNPGGLNDDTIISKIKTAAVSRLIKKTAESPAPNKPPATVKSTVDRTPFFNRLVIIGSSTGGPRALLEVVPYFPPDIPAAIMIVQHMPPVFTKSFAERLNQLSKIEVKEAQDGSVLARGKVLIALGDFHMVLRKEKIVLNQDPPNLGVRPSVDNTMISAADNYGPAVIGVILTGMGMDGTRGASAIKSKGGKVFAQDEATSAIYGMPQSVARAGLTDRIFPLQKIAQEITEACTAKEQHHEPARI
jgi:two-component system, chemotaxis family, protein-glutamate methylesterase/glutaminase